MELQTFLEDLAAGLPDRAFALLQPESASPPIWRLLWSSRPINERQVGLLSPNPETVDWPGLSGGVGIALVSKLHPLGVIAWPLADSANPAELLEALEACREVYWEASERRWMNLLLSLLSALKEQRREVGTAIHRGPAQALTAARLELSMMGQTAQEGPVAQAIEQASESLVQLVHGKLRGRSQEATLVGTLRGELDFQARWHGLPTGGETVSLPAGALSVALADLWKLAGGEVHQDDRVTTFKLRGTS